MLPPERYSSRSIHPPTGDPFATTHWSVVISAGNGATHALEALCKTYWYPLYAYVRRQGKSPEDAEDLTQGFFARFLERNDFGKADPGRGRFRAYLLACLNNFIAEEYKRSRAIKRGGGQVPLSFDAKEAEERWKLEPLDTLSPDRLFDRRWALTIMAQANERLRAEYTAAGKSELYALLKDLEPGAHRTLSLAEIALLTGKTESAVRTESSRLRQRRGELIRDEVAQTVSNPAELEEELRYLLSAWSG